MSTQLRLFQGYGVELEYMVVEAETLDVFPVVDRILASQAGETVSEVDVGPLAWSNELVLHVVELKTNGPAASLTGLQGTFQDHVARVSGILSPMGGLLLPTAMHPWMDPLRETVLWPYEYSPVYQAYDRIFGCQGHGWSNLQSTHLNLPFGSDEEFGRLHAAIRLILPLLPGLAASSPVVEGRTTGFLDTRMEVYRTNSRRVPMVAGDIIPEPVFTRQAYEEEILGGMYRAIAPLDPEGILRDEFLNSRGAIARFGRGSIEIRVVDVQEAPRADLAVVALTAGALQLLTGQDISEADRQKAIPTSPLAKAFRETTRRGEYAVIQDPEYLGALGFPGRKARVSEIWWHLLERGEESGFLEDPSHRSDARTLVHGGTLSTRILQALGLEGREKGTPVGPVPREHLEEVFRELARCLRNGQLFPGS
jgi:gamma-glutamyl:cysteine ligase YbdK (ATP-grasp superfamily)